MSLEKLPQTMSALAVVQKGANFGAHQWLMVLSSCAAFVQQIRREKTFEISTVKGDGLAEKMVLSKRLATTTPLVNSYELSRVKKIRMHGCATEKYLKMPWIGGAVYQ